MAQKYLHWIYATDPESTIYVCGRKRRPSDCRLTDFYQSRHPADWTTNNYIFHCFSLESSLRTVREKKSSAIKPWCRRCNAELEHQLVIASLTGEQED